MEIINLPRGYGKTTNIIIKAAKTGYPIITLYDAMRRWLLLLSYFSVKIVKIFGGDDEWD